jgi:hypothetical protein
VKPLDETHGPVFELTRHFLARIFDSELFATPGQWRTVATGCLAMLLTARMALFDLDSASRFRHSAPPSMDTIRFAHFSGQLAPLVLLMCVCGLLAILQWQMLLPSRADYFALASLPVRPRQIFTARFIAFCLFTTIVALTLNAIPALLVRAPFTSGVPWVLACYFPFFAIVALQGLLVNTLSGRWYARAAAAVQGVLSCTLFLGALSSFHVAGWAPDRETLLRRFAWAPPVWFAGLEQTFHGSGEPVMHAFAARAVFAVTISLLLAVAAYFVSYRRYRALLLEAPREAASGARNQWSLLNLLARDPRQAAIIHFMANTIARSRTHRLVLLAYAGSAAGILINSLLIAQAAEHWSASAATTLKFMVYYWPIVASMIVIPGLRHIFRLPAELNANWLFRITESQGRAQWMSAVERVIVVYAILPIYLMSAPAAVAVLGWSVAGRLLILQWLASMAMFEALFYSWQQLPFACSYAPGQRPVMTILGKYLAAIFMAAPPLAVLIASFSQLPATFAILVSVFAAAWLRMRYLRRQGWGEANLIYEDSPDAMADLGLKA